MSFITYTSHLLNGVALRLGEAAWSILEWHHSKFESAVATDNLPDTLNSHTPDKSASTEQSATRHT